MPRLLARSLIALALLGCSGSKGTPAAQAADAASLQPAATSAAAAGSADSTLAKADGGRIIGDAKATVWLIMISDFQCPYCKQWHDETWSALNTRYVATGKLRVAYVNLPLPMHKNAFPAAEAAMCASIQGKFWPVQDGLFRTQQEWKDAADPQPLFEGLAKEAGADVAALRSCVKSGATRPLIQADMDRAASAGASSTPMFFVGGKALLGAQPLSVFSEAIDAALAAKPAGK